MTDTLKRLHDEYTLAEKDDSISWQVCSAARGTLKVYLFDHAADFVALIEAARDVVAVSAAYPLISKLRNALQTFEGD